MEKKKYSFINPNEVYQIALPTKFVDKYCPKDSKASFIPTGQTMNNIFMDYLKTHNYEIQITPSIFERRISS